MLRRLAVLVIMTVLLGLPAVTQAVAPTCAPGTVFLESQGWWKDNVRPSDAVGEHVHVGVCFPWGGTATGTVSFNVRILLHNNPATLLALDPHIVYPPDTQYHPYANGGIAINQTAPGGNGEWTIPVTFDTTRVPFDGWQEFRFFVRLRHADGTEQHASTGWALYLQNGKPVDHYKPDAQAPNFTEARGWYSFALTNPTNGGYTNARWASAARTTPVTGNWTFNVSLAPGSGGKPVSYSAVYVDPDFHAGSSGTLIRESNGQYVGAVTINTALFPDGAHRLVLRADSVHTIGRNSGLLVIPFTSANGVAPSPTPVPPTPSPTPVCQ